MSRITLYQTEITPQKNMWVDSINSYLSSIPIEKTLTINNFQYFNPKMSVDIVVNVHQLEYGTGGYNYVAVDNDGINYYYFITDFNWCGSESVRLSLVLDTINSFKFTLTDKTKITRQHIDRFKKRKSDDGKYYIRNIRLESENILPTLYQYRHPPYPRVLRDPVYDMNFYLYYKNRDKPTLDNKDNPVDCFLVADEPILVKKYDGQVSDPVEIIWSDLISTYPSGYEYSRYFFDNVKNRSGVFEIYTRVNESQEWQLVKTFTNSELVSHAIVQGGGSTISNKQGFRIARLTYKLGTGEKYELVKTEDVYITTNIAFQYKFKFTTGDSLGISGNNDYSKYLNNYYDIANLERRIDVKSGITSDLYIKPVNAINRADPRGIKLILLPYAPDEFKKNEKGEIIFNPDKWFYTEDMLKLNDLNGEFKRYFTNKSGNWSYQYQLFERISLVDSDKFSKRYTNYKYESQLYHSDYFKFRFIYDSFYTEIPLEFISQTTYESAFFDLEYKVTNTINSNILFRVICRNANVKTVSDYPYVFISTRNNEMPLYNSAYINYINTGFNYDKKAKAREERMRWLNTGLQAGASVLSFALGGVTGGLSLVAGAGFITSGISSIASNINATKASEDAINRKLAETNNVPVSVAGSNDVDLMKEYTGNRVQLEEWEMSDEMRKQVADLFYYYGLTYPYQEMPNTTSRVWFNYLQCDPVFDTETNTSLRHEFLEDLKNRFILGVTRYHINSGQYDFEQQYENWETFLFE